MHRSQPQASIDAILAIPRTGSLKRRRAATSMRLLALAAAGSIAAVQALSSRTATVTQRNPLLSRTGISDETIARQLPRTVAQPAIQYLDDDDDYYDDDDDDEYDEDDMFEGSMAGFQRLQKSTGSEILQSDLQKQIDESASRPNDFLDKQGAVSAMEKMAMSSITEQLPQRAVQALRQEKSTKRSSNLNYAGNRVSHEQEIHLARIIQQGVVLHNLRSNQETAAGRSLTRQEWADLAGLSAKELRRKVSDYRKAKQELVTANLGLVHAVVNQQWAVYSKLGIAKEELVQEGSLGLLRAAELFDPERGLRFSTYATIWTKASLSNSHMTELVHLPAREKTKWNKIVRAHKDLQEAGETATVHELAAVTGMAVEEVLATQRKMSQAQRVLSLDYEYNTLSRSGTESVAVNTMQNDKAFQQDADLAERTQMHADVVAAMTRNLDAREARLMRLRYGLSDGHMRSLAECADAMGLSQTRVQQLSQQCLKKLREAVEAESLEEYLLTIA